MDCPKSVKTQKCQKQVPDPKILKMPKMTKNVEKEPKMGSLSKTYFLVKKGNLGCKIWDLFWQKWVFWPFFGFLAFLTDFGLFGQILGLVRQNRIGDTNKPDPAPRNYHYFVEVR